MDKFSSNHVLRQVWKFDSKGHLNSEQICKGIDFPKLQRKSMSSQICSEIKWPLLQDMIRNNQANQIMCLTLVDKIELSKYTIFRIITDFYMKQPSNSISAWWLAKNYDLKNFLIDSCFTIKSFKFNLCTWLERWVSNFWTKF